MAMGDLDMDMGHIQATQARARNRTWMFKVGCRILEIGRKFSLSNIMFSVEHWRESVRYCSSQLQFSD